MYTVKFRFILRRFFLFTPSGPMKRLKNGNNKRKTALLSYSGLAGLMMEKMIIPPRKYKRIIKLI